MEVLILMAGIKKALAVVVVTAAAVVLSPGTPPAMSAPTSSGSTVSADTLHCC